MQLYKFWDGWRANRFFDEALASARKEVVKGFKLNAAKCLLNLFRQFTASLNSQIDNRRAL